MYEEGDPYEGMQGTLKAPKGLPILQHEAVGPLLVNENEEHLLLVRVTNHGGDELLDQAMAGAVRGQYVDYGELRALV